MPGFASRAVEYQGRQPREIQLSEQGLNSRDYSDRALTEQAAGLAYAWAKIAPLKSITAFQYHIWSDARSEGGLRLGLRKFSNEPGDPFGKNRAGMFFRRSTPPNGDEATKFALPIIGIKNWSEVHYTGEIK